MGTEKREIIIFGIIGIAFGILICGLGGWLFYLETGETKRTYFFFGISLRGKTLAAIVGWLGFITLFFTIRKMVRRLSQNAIN